MSRRHQRTADIEVVKLKVRNTLRQALDAAGLPHEEAAARCRKIISRRQFFRVLNDPDCLPNACLLVGLQVMLSAKQEDLLAIVALETRDAI